jgi:L-asparagine transporter-like permease
VFSVALFAFSYLWGKRQAQWPFRFAAFGLGAFSMVLLRVSIFGDERFFFSNFFKIVLSVLALCGAAFLITGGRPRGW